MTKKHEFQDVWTAPGASNYHAYKDCGYLNGGYVGQTHTEARSHGKDLCQYCEKQLLDERKIGDGT